MFALRAHKKGTKGASVCVVGEEEEKEEEEDEEEEEEKVEEEEVLIKGVGTFF